MNKQIENLTKLIASNAKQHAEQVAALQDQFNERERNPRRGRSFVMRPWMAEATIQALPTVSTAPVLVLNGPMDGDCVRWKKKRDELIAKWTELCMYDPTKTWGNCATNNDKVQMVCHACFIVCHCTGMSNVCVCVCMPSASTQAAIWGGRPLSSTAGWNISTPSAASAASRGG